MLRYDSDFLADIEQECLFIVANFKKITYGQFVDDEILIRAVSRSMEIIGEAVKNLSLELKNNHSVVSWKEIAGFRDKLIHHYFGIDYELVWEVIQNEIPDLLTNVTNILRAENI